MGIVGQVRVPVKSPGRGASARDGPVAAKALEGGIGPSLVHPDRVPAARLEAAPLARPNFTAPPPNFTAGRESLHR